MSRKVNPHTVLSFFRLNPAGNPYPASINSQLQTRLKLVIPKGNALARLQSRFALKPKNPV